MEKERFFAVIKDVPKAEIHLHIEDFIIEETHQFETLPQMLEAVRAAQNSRKNINDFERPFRRLARYMIRNGIVYAEVFFSVPRYINNGFAYSQMVECFEKLIKQIKQKDGLIVNMIADLSRTYGVDSANNVLNMVLKYRNKYVIGIGLGGDEKIGPAKDFTEIFEKARSAGLRTVAHAGESDTYNSVVDTAELLKAQRIGHGVSAAADEATIQLLASKKIPLEIQLTSNIITGHFVQKIEDHPVRLLWDRGVFITLNTDDPNLFKTSLLNEYWLLHNKLGFSMNDIYCIIINGFRASFLSPGKREEFIRLVNKKWNRRFLLTERMKHKGWQDACKNVFNGVE